MAAMTTSLAPGQIFAKRYEVVRCIGSGGMGAVYEVIHLETERRRALKVMHAHFADSPDFRERFKREARVAAQIDSDYIVDVFDAGVDDATKMPFLAMELLRGEEVARTLRRIDRMSPPEVVSCLHQTALALDRTHKAGIVHRDLKPENLFLCERDDGPPQIKVLDFGIAKFATSAKGGAGQATNNVGTPLYMAPEQFQQGIEVTPLADVYALGLLAYTLLVGTDYWHEELERDENVFSFALIAMKAPIENASSRALRVAGITLSPAFDAWFKRVTAFTPEARYATATETVRELARALAVNLPAPSPTAASLQGLGTDVISPDWLIPDTAHLSRATPAGSATTMDLPGMVVPKRRWKLVAIGGSVLVAAALAWMLRAGNAASPEAASVAAQAPVAAPAAPRPSVAPDLAPSVELEHQSPNAEPRADEAPARAAAAKARPKAAKAPAPKAPPKPIYSRD
jgi:serine/threonine-protein kinase